MAKNIKKTDGAGAEIAASATDTVTICCNYPRDIRFDIPTANGKMTPLIVNGNATHLRGKPKGVLPVGAYGFTPNVPREMWDALVRSRPDDPLFKTGTIFAVDGRQAADAAAERKDIRNGLEPIDPARMAANNPTEIIKAVVDFIDRFTDVPQDNIFA